MPIIQITYQVRAPRERVFDLSRSVDLHTRSTAQTHERAVAGVTTGLLELGDQVTWEATHLGQRRRLTAAITQYDKPNHFRDSMVQGPFQSFDHDHIFQPDPHGTRVTERFNYRAPWGILGRLAETIFLTAYMRSFLMKRADIIRQTAESDQWREFLPG